MESVGERLRRVRLERGLDIHVIADELRISARYLEAIETGDTKILPGGFFSKSFCQQYGNYLGVCDEQFEAAVEYLFGGEEAVPLANRGPRETAIGIAPIPTGSKRDQIRKPLISLAVLLVVVAACSGLYALWQHLQQPAPIEQAALVTPPTQTATAPPAAPASEPATASPAQTAPPPITPAPEAKSGLPSGLALNLAASEKVWISVTSNGKVLFSGVLEPSQTKALEAGDNARLLIGNAGGVDVQWKGRSLGSIGPRGQVRVVVLKPEGFEILPPKIDVAPKL
jgi:cytoskeletal protein RodZ